MSEANSSSNGTNTNASGQGGDQNQNNQNAGGANGNTSNSDAVKNAEAVLAKNKELLAELNRLKGENKSFLDKAAEAEQEKLMAAGKKDEVIANLQKQITELKTSGQTTQSRYAKTAVEDQILIAARSMGSDKPETVLKLIDQTGITVDDNFRVNKDQLNAALAKVKEDVPALFRKAAGRMNDLDPQSAKDMNLKPDTKKMSREQLREAYVKASQNQK